MIRTQSARSAWTTVATRTVVAAGTRFAYRQLGGGRGVPVVMLNHWGANLDNFDPSIVEALADGRPVFAFDYRGVGASCGDAPVTVTVSAMADDMLAAIHALGLDTIDLMGFSLGGFVAQDMILKRPKLVRRLILTGTGQRAAPASRRSARYPGR